MRALLLALVLLPACHALPEPPRQWTPLNSPTKASLRGMALRSAEEFWLSGQAGTLLHTRDGGRSFLSLELPGEQRNELRDLALLPDGSLLVMACQPARIYRSTDGGKSFSKVYEAGRKEAFLDAMAFFDGRRGLCFGDPLDGKLLVLRTEDGGETWQRTAALPAAQEGEGGFAASGTCMAVLPDGRAWIGTGGPVSRVFYSLDFGRSFAVTSSKLRTGEAAGVFSLSFEPGGSGVLLGGKYTEPEARQGTAAFSPDGQRFLPLNRDLPRGYRSCVARHPVHHKLLLATGPSGTDFSQDGGRSWQAHSSKGFHVLGFCPDGSCIAAGSEGRIARLR